MTKNFTDALGKDLIFIVLRKKNKLQILYRPRKKQVRGKGKRGWDLLAAIDHSEKEERQLLDRLLEGFLNDLSGHISAPKVKVEKVKKKDSPPRSITEGKVKKGSQNPPLTSNLRPPALSGSKIDRERDEFASV